MILLTGGSGLLGRELQKYLNCYAPSHKELDITNENETIGLVDYDLIIHAAAFTDVVEAEKDKQGCYYINVQGTINLLKSMPDTPFVFISSEYAYNPTNYYAETKLAAETAIKAFAKKYLIIRTSFCIRPWPYDNAFINAWTQGDYIDIIAPMIVKKIKAWDKIHSNLIYVGTKRKRVYDLAIKTQPNVRPSSVKEIKSVTIPTDYI